MLNKKDNIQVVTDNEMCVGCGACISICPKNCIALNINEKGFFQADVNDDVCINCGLCRKTCPSIQTMDDEGKFIAKEMKLISNNNKDKVNKCQSGGAITSIIEMMFESGEITGALLTKFDSKLKSKMELVTDKEKVIEYSGSKYCTADISGAIKQLEGYDGRVAVVGVPCQINAIKNSIKLNKKIKCEVVAYIGLICDRVLSYNFIEYVSDKYVDKSQGKVIGFKYRSKAMSGWPGDIEIETEKGKKNVSRTVRMIMKPYYTMKRCYYCSLKANPEADVVVGDPYNFHDVIPHNNYSQVLINTQKGLQLINKLEKSPQIDVIVGDITKVEGGQNFNKKFKMAKCFRSYDKKVVEEVIKKKLNTNTKLGIRDKVNVVLLNKARAYGNSMIIKRAPLKVKYCITRVLNKISW